MQDKVQNTGLGTYTTLYFNVQEHGVSQTARIYGFSLVVAKRETVCVLCHFLT
jgi:hypothetical protein